MVEQAWLPTLPFFDSAFTLSQASWKDNEIQRILDYFGILQQYFGSRRLALATVPSLSWNDILIWTITPAEAVQDTSGTWVPQWKGNFRERKAGPQRWPHSIAAKNDDWPYLTIVFWLGRDVFCPVLLAKFGNPPGDFAIGKPLTEPWFANLAPPRRPPTPWFPEKKQNWLPPACAKAG